jgi:hypothetical protein
MFSFRSLIHAHRPQSDDELISAYIDGQLDERARQAFEARIAVEPALRRHVEATRMLVQTARAMPESRAPRNFALPRSVGAPARAPSQQMRVWWRLGSAVAAAVFVFAVGLDVSGVTRVTQGTLQQPVAAPQQGLAAESATNSASASVTATGALSFGKASPKVAQATAADSAGNSALPPQLLAVPTGTAETAAPPSILSAPVETGTQPAGAGAAIAPQPTATEPSVASSQRLSVGEATTETSGIIPTPALADTPVPTAVPAATSAAYAVQQSRESAPAIDWLGAVAVLAFVLSILMGIAGWVRR